MEGQWIEIFKTGLHKAINGCVMEVTEVDLVRIANSYDPSKYSAPIFIGHPEDNAPAFGWVDSLKIVDQTLFFKARKVDPEFEKMVNIGLFKKRSISLFPDGTLRHVGFLGAMPPDVKD
jgi:hypothetical protein